MKKQLLHLWFTTRLVLVFTKAHKIHFQRKLRYKVVVLGQPELPYYRGIGRQSGRRLFALAQVFGRTALPFLGKRVVPAAKHVGSDLLVVSVPEIAEVLEVENFQEC